MSDFTWLRKIVEARTPGPWHLSGDRIIQTSHVTRDVWEIPRSEGDMPFIATAGTIADAWLAVVEAALPFKFCNVREPNCRECDSCKLNAALAALREMGPKEGVP